MKRVVLLIAAVLVCMGGCYKETQEDTAIVARPITQTYVGELEIVRPDYGESLEQKRGEFSRKVQELKRTIRVRRLPMRTDTIEVCRPVID